MTSAKMSPAYSRSPASPSALSASASPGGTHGPGGRAWRPGDTLAPSRLLSGTRTLGGSGSGGEAAGLCRREEGSGVSAPETGPGWGGTLTAASHQHPPGWRRHPSPAPTSSRWSRGPVAGALNVPARMRAEHPGRCRGNGERPSKPKVGQLESNPLPATNYVIGNSPSEPPFPQLQSRDCFQTCKWSVWAGAATSSLLPGPHPL